MVPVIDLLSITNANPGDNAVSWRTQHMLHLHGFGAAMLVDALPPAKAMLADRGYDADLFRAALAARGIARAFP